MKVTDLIAEWLAKNIAPGRGGLPHIFLVNGGANLHLVDSISKRKDIAYVCPQGEQPASFQADAYARLQGFGVALATSGPGASNLITGIATSYYDSVPVLYLTGNQTRDRMSGDSGCRQIGFQETPIVDICARITKYAITVMRPDMMLVELERAVQIAKHGRKGPVLIDIPDDVGRANV